MEKPALKKKGNWFKRKFAFRLKNPVKLPPLIKWNLLKARNNKLEEVYMFYTHIRLFKKMHSVPFI
jgi:hypothetical protein